MTGCAPGVAKTGKCGSANASRVQTRRENVPNFAATGTTNSCSLVRRKQDKTMRMETETMQNKWMAMMYNILYAVYEGTKTPPIEKQGTIIRFFRTIFIFI